MVKKRKSGGESLKRDREEQDLAVLQQAKGRASELIRLGNSDEHVFLMLTLEYEPSFVEQHKDVLLAGAMRKAKKKKAKANPPQQQQQVQAGKKTQKTKPQQREQQKASLSWQPAVAGHGLAAQMQELAEWLVPTAREVQLREQTIARLRQTAEGATVTVVGSFAHGLWLPNADVDVVMEQHAGSLRAVARSIRKIGQRVTLLESARVPIIKYVDSKTGVPVDVSFNIRSGIQLNSLLSSVLEQHRSGDMLIRVVKYYLNGFPKLCDPSCGGLGSYSIFCLCVSFLQHQEAGPPVEAGQSCKAFFGFWGQSFNSDVLGVSLLNGGSFFAKKTHGEDFHGPLTLEDPLDSTNNISRATHRWLEVKRLFLDAFVALSEGKSLAQVVSKTQMKRLR